MNNEVNYKNNNNEKSFDSKYNVISNDSQKQEYLDKSEEILMSVISKTNELNEEKKKKPCGFFVKIRKNILLTISIFSLMLVYYVYMRFNIFIMISRTNKGLDFHYILNINFNSHNDDIYFICIFYLFVFHLLFFLLLISLLKTSLKSPGYLDKKYVRIYKYIYLSLIIYYLSLIIY